MATNISACALTCVYGTCTDSGACECQRGFFNDNNLLPVTDFIPGEQCNTSVADHYPNVCQSKSTVSIHSIDLPLITDVFNSLPLPLPFPLYCLKLSSRTLLIQYCRVGSYYKLSFLPSTSRAAPLLSSTCFVSTQHVPSM